MAKLIDLGGAPVNDGEIVAVRYFKDNLPDNYLIYPNIEIPRPSGPALEYDMVVIAPHAVYAVEVKDWHGTIKGSDNYDWAIGKSTRSNPVKSINYKAKVLKGRIDKYGPAYRDIWVEGLVVIVDSRTVLALSGECAKKTLLLAKAVEFIQKPQRLITPYPIASDAVKNALDVVKRAVGEDGSRGRSQQPLKFNQYQVVETLAEEEGLTEYLAKNSLITSTQRTRLRVFEFSPYLPREEAERRRQLITHEYKLVQEIGFHQNILPVRELFEFEGNKIIEVTDWNEEGTLARLLVEERPLTIPQKLEMMRGLLYGLAALHRKGILHRAIRPSNIMLGESLTPRFMNFDRARLDSPGPKANQYTVWQMPVEPAEVAYLAPELAEVNYKAYPSSDLYSLGIVCFELITGLRPVDRPQDALRANFPNVKVSEFVEGLPPGLDHFITTLLQPDPARRLRDAEAALAEFDKLTQPEKDNQPPSSSQEEDDSQTPIRKDYKPNDLIEGQYRVVSELGRGGSSRVYKVYNYLHDRQYAMKIINEGVQIGRLQKEFQTLSSLDHPSIARAIWAGQIYQGQYYLVTELVEGESLSNYTEGSQRMSIVEAVDLAKELLNALDYLHTPQPNRPAILHRDIKPSNLMRVRQSLKVIDFNIATQLDQASRTMIGTIGYVAPDVIMAGWDASCDLFSAGVVLYQLITQRHPFQDVDQPTAATEPPDLRQFVPDLSPAFAAFLVKACMPLRKDRFTSASQMLTALTQSKPYVQLRPVRPAGGLADTIKVTEDELARPNYNPYVTRFLTLYSQAKRSNRGTRGLDDVAKATYVPTLLDQRLQPAILEGDYRLVIITGNAGDGKTAFIQNLENQVREAGQAVQSISNGNGSRFEFNGYTFTTNYDGSQDEGENVNDVVLREFFGPFAGPQPLQPAQEVRIIAINEGRLRDFLEVERDSFDWLRRQVLNFFDEVETGQLPPGLLIVNLNWRSVVAGGPDSIFSRQLKVFADDSFWQPCESCGLRDRCFIKFNIDTFRDPLNGAEATERMRTLFETVHLRRRLHITMRDTRSALAYMLFRDHNCEDVAQALQIAILDPTPYLNNFYYNVLVGPDALATQQIGNQAEQNSDHQIEVRPDRLIKLLTQIDVALVSNPQQDREMHFDGKTGGPPLMQFSPRSRVDEVMLELLQNKLTFGYEVAQNPALITLHRIFHHMERRKAFFERRETGWLRMLPYEQLERFRQIVATQPPQPAERAALKRELIGGISASEGSRNRRRNQNFIWLRASQTNKPTIKSYRLFPEKEFELIVPDIGTLRDYLEYTPDHLVLRHKERGSEAALDLTLDVMELLFSVSQGFKPSLNELRGSYINLTIFRNSLSHLPFRELILTENDREFYQLRADETNKIILSKEEAF